MLKVRKVSLYKAPRAPTKGTAPHALPASASHKGMSGAGSREGRYTSEIGATNIR